MSLDKKGIIVIDVDGVIVDVMPNFIEKINAHFGTTYLDSDITSFHLDQVLPPDQFDFMMNLWSTDTLYDNLTVEEDVLSALDKMKGFARLVACSSPMPGHIRSKYEFIEKLGFSRDDIVLTKGKDILKADIRIDDHTENLTDPESFNICFAKSWNTFWDEKDGPRTDDWEKIVKLTEEKLRS